MLQTTKRGPFFLLILGPRLLRLAHQEQEVS